MKSELQVLSYVDDILVVCRCIQINAQTLTFNGLKCFFKSLCPSYKSQFFRKIMAYEEYNFHYKHASFLEVNTLTF